MDSSGGKTTLSIFLILQEVIFLVFEKMDLLGEGRCVLLSLLDTLGAAVRLL